MTRRRGANRNARNSRVRIGFDPSYLNNSTIIETFINGVFSSSLTQFNGTYFPIHPNYGLAGGTVVTSLNRLSIVGNTTTSGLYNKIIIKKVECEFTFTNLEAFDIYINVLKVNSNLYSTLATNYQDHDLSLSSSARVILSAKGVYGYIKTIKFLFIPHKVDGVTYDAYKANNNNWSTQTVIQSNSQLIHTQASSPSGTAFTTAGVEVNAKLRYHVDLIGQNVIMKN